MNYNYNNNHNNNNNNLENRYYFKGNYEMLAI
jgi:hypothetical protein